MENELKSPDLGDSPSATTPVAVEVSRDVTVISQDPMAVWDEMGSLSKEIERLIDATKGRRERRAKSEGGWKWTIPPDVKGYALAIREWRGLIEMKAKMLGMYDTKNGDLLAGYMKRFGDAIAALLKDDPAAQEAVYKAIEQVERK